MPAWRVMIHGSGINVPFADISPSSGDESSMIGFYATRTVVAADAEEAAARGLQRMAQEWATGAYAPTGATPVLVVDNVWRVAWWHRFFGPRAGATFYARE